MAKPKGRFRSGFENDVYLGSLKGTKAKYESLSIPYIKPATNHKYTPDFILPNGIIIEVKGRFTAYDRAKHLLVREQHPELDIRFIFAYDNKIHKNSQTRYSDWCEKHGYKYDFKLVPKKWITEKKKDIALGADTNKRFTLMQKIMNVLLVKSVTNLQRILKHIT